MSTKTEFIKSKQFLRHVIDNQFVLEQCSYICNLCVMNVDP